MTCLICEGEEAELCKDEGHAHASEQRARASAGLWSRLLSTSTRSNGEGDYLNGRLIHCGSILELQAIEHRSDDYGEYTAATPHGDRGPLRACTH